MTSTAGSAGWPRRPPGLSRDMMRILSPAPRQKGYILATKVLHASGGSSMPGRPPSIRALTRDYEAWLGSQTPLVAADVRQKHVNMGLSPFAFLRASYYLWAREWIDGKSELAQAPVVTAVGDLHIENFGTWRDAEGRLAWGINDFDEASPLPYTNDLVRLAASAFLAVREHRLALSEKEIARALLRGYERALSAEGQPLVLAESHRRVGERVLEFLVEPRYFWKQRMASALRPTP